MGWLPWCMSANVGGKHCCNGFTIGLGIPGDPLKGMDGAKAYIKVVTTNKLSRPSESLSLDPPICDCGCCSPDAATARRARVRVA
jgi:hypothetical protein